MEKLIFDARGNGGGIISPTLTGDHQNRITDYTAIVVIVEDNKTALETDEASEFTAVDCRNATENNKTSREKTIVRRLTPLECERLQGLPDDWTDIGEWVDSKGKKHKDADSPRYKALGNSIATPFWFYLLRRISAQYERPATLGSLFDGIGGFPLCWERCNGIGTALWSSEVEEFCIAVAKKHFGDEEAGTEGDISRYL